MCHALANLPGHVRGTKSCHACVAHSGDDVALHDVERLLQGVRPLHRRDLHAGCTVHERDDLVRRQVRAHRNHHHLSPPHCVGVGDAVLLFWCLDANHRLGAEHQHRGCESGTLRVFSISCACACGCTRTCTVARFSLYSAWAHDCSVESTNCGKRASSPGWNTSLTSMTWRSTCRNMNNPPVLKLTVRNPRKGAVCVTESDPYRTVHSSKTSRGTFPASPRTRGPRTQVSSWPRLDQFWATQVHFGEPEAVADSAARTTHTERTPSDSLLQLLLSPC